MAVAKKSTSPSPRRRPPATTPEGRENQMIDLAITLAEKQLAEGSASSQVITHFLKLATTRERLEQEKLARENELLRAKSDSIASGERIQELYENAIKAMRSYQGADELESDDYA